MSPLGRRGPAAQGPFPDLTPRETAVLEAIGEMRLEGVTPSYARLASAIGRTSGAVFAPVKALVEKGFLTMGRSARSIRPTAIGEAFLPPALSAWDWDERRAS